MRLATHHTKGLVEAGCDEAGRGCLAGPVVAAAVVLPPRVRIPGLNDSKKLNAARREELRPLIEEKALAWAVAEAVHSVNRSRCLFATHYHELSRLAETCEALSLHHVRAREWQGDLVLLHELAEGPADRSYGLAVAKLAGVPAPVVARARSVLERLEKGRTETGGLAAGLGDLPLFAAAAAAPEEPADTLRDRLAALDIDALSPREALDLLYELRREAIRVP